MKEKLKTKKAKIIVSAILMLLLVAVLTLVFNTGKSSRFLSMLQGKESEFLASGEYITIDLDNTGLDIGNYAWSSFRVLNGKAYDNMWRRGNN